MLTAPTGQDSASKFPTSPPAVFGHLPVSAMFDPTCPNARLFSALVPTADEIAASRPFDYFESRIGFRPWGEQETLGVKDQLTYMLSAEVDPRFQGLVMNGTNNFTSRGMQAGYSNGASFEDFNISFSPGVVVGIGEIKGQESGILAAIIQAAIGASHVALGLLSRGLEAGTFYVPVISTTGSLMHFGATVVLPVSFCTYIPVSDVFNLANLDQNRAASAFLAKAVAYARTLDVRVQEVARQVYEDSLKPTPPVTTMELDSSHHVKTYVLETFSRGPGLFTRYETADITDMMPGWSRMVQSFNALFRNPNLRASIAFPLAMVTPQIRSKAESSASSSGSGSGSLSSKSGSLSSKSGSASSTSGSASMASSFSSSGSALADSSACKLVFHNWTTRGFRIGCPDRTDAGQEPLFKLFKAQLYRVVDMMHAAGVLHCDLYFSNIMWREHEGRVEIKLIDFDCSHLLSAGNDFAPRVRTRLEEYFNQRCFRDISDHCRQVVLHPSHDLKFISIVELEVTTANARHWESLASNNKAKIDTSFRALLAEALLKNLQGTQTTE